MRTFVSIWSNVHTLNLGVRKLNLIERCPYSDTLINWYKLGEDIMLGGPENNDCNVISKSKERWFRRTLFSCFSFLPEVKVPEKRRQNPSLRSSLFWTIAFRNVILVHYTDKPIG
jgi:hypothetical protein